MKAYPYLLALTMFVGAFGCNDSKESNSKNIIYEVRTDEAFSFKGEYRDADGRLVTVDAQTPWRVELKGVGSGFKASLGGYLFSTNASSVKGRASLKVVDAKDASRVISNDAQNFDLFQEGGYTADELKQATQFSLSE